MPGGTKILAMYLPQYHEIPENNAFWGEGYTDWVAVKNGKKYFIDHEQPKRPLNGNFYDLSNVDAIKWQVDTAKEYGIDGFCIYHYWFSSQKKLLEKPAELILDHPEIKMPFCFGWDNAPWKRTWSACYGNDWAPQYEKAGAERKQGILVDFEYGEESDWENHFSYLLRFFRDDRYIKIGNRPVFIVLNYYLERTLDKIKKCWNDLAIREGFDGMYFIGRSDGHKRNLLFNAEFFYQPIFSGFTNPGLLARVANKVRNLGSEAKKTPKIFRYDLVWKGILSLARRHKEDPHYLYGAFVNYDDTPRRGSRGKVFEGTSAAKFKKYLQKLIELSESSGKAFIFLTAWNEWGEGAYLEPDETEKDSYLRAIKDIVT
jgi:hypothetical protein